MVKESTDPIMAIEVPDDWNLSPLGECVTEKLSYGINAPAIPYNPNYPRYIRITDITENGQFDSSDPKSVNTDDREKYTLKEGDIVLARTGASTGKSYLYRKKDGELVYAGFLIKAAIDTKRHNPRFIAGQLTTKRYWNWVATVSMRSGQPGINGKEYASFLIPIASKMEQDLIAYTISQFDTYIDDLAELIEKKRGIRDGALEDLIHHRTRLDGFNGNWITVTFNQVITPKARIGWQGLKKHEYLRSGYSYLIGGTDFSHGTVILDNIWYVSKDRYDMDANIQMSKNDVLVTKDGTIGKVALVPKLGKPATLNSGVFVFRTNNRLLPTFLFRVLSSSVFREFIDTLSAGSTIKHLYQKDLKNFEFEIPVDKKEQEAIANTLTAMDEEIEALEIERDKMIQIREGAMDDLLTGRVRLKV